MLIYFQKSNGLLNNEKVVLLEEKKFGQQVLFLTETHPVVFFVII